MVYDHNVNMNEVYAPVQTNIVIRSQSGKNSKKNTESKFVQAFPKQNIIASNGQRIDINKFTNFLQGISSYSSSQKCAKSIRLALESAGARFQSHPVAAADWGNTLMKIGYRQINPKFDAPKEGDIYIIDRTGKHVYGHIAGFNGTQWVSDFKQKSYDVYNEKGLTYKYYRPSF
ncbi:CHAP domain-containing protein [Acinetobacter sp. ANC 5378]|uniref:CHAP domain-containing protein n=1 Tax=Acinetobacter sp. ANC 5378 TaxID=2731249 RepID=UPI00148FFDAF|nr:CHAP domain-containing protein [Acinetobacter sp. ANC 5378]NNG80990.1 CHAP domain-containing protein [Acinetobacter sp. ANC 5378]